MCPQGGVSEAEINLKATSEPDLNWKKELYPLSYVDLALNEKIH